MTSRTGPRLCGNDTATSDDPAAVDNGRAPDVLRKIQINEKKPLQVPAVLPSRRFFVDELMRYYFDLRDGNEVARDEEGLELRSMERVRQEAAKTLADMVRDAVLSDITNGLPRQLAIEVRTDCGTVLQARFSLEMGGRRHS
jgi:hypothetical protein